jgi:hypothetical protein
MKQSTYITRRQKQYNPRPGQNGLVRAKENMGKDKPIFMNFGVKKFIMKTTQKL